MQQLGISRRATSYTRKNKLSIHGLIQTEEQERSGNARMQKFSTKTTSRADNSGYQK